MTYAVDKFAPVAAITLFVGYAAVLLVQVVLQFAA
jgi:hypothetical protein